MAKMTGFVFQDEYLDKLAKLSDQEVGRLVRALAKYHMTEEEQELTGRESIAYDFIRDDIDRIEQKYQAKCEKNRQIRQRALTNVNERQRTLSDDDKVKDKVKDKDIYKQQRAREETAVGEVEVDPLILKVQQELNGLTDTHYQALNDYREELSDEVVSYAIDSAVANGIRNWAYVAAILRDYSRNGVKTVGAAKAQDEKHREKKGSQPRLLRAQQYEQREYHEEELVNTLGVDDLFKGAAG